MMFCMPVCTVDFFTDMTFEDNCLPQLFYVVG